MKIRGRQAQSRLDRQEVRATIENFRWFSKFSPVEKLRIVRRSSAFLRILKNAR